MRLLIVEDEVIAARGLERMVREILGTKLQSVRIQKTLTSAMLHLEDEPVDLMLLDLNLKGEDGFELIRDAMASSFQTIVVSANIDRALEAFELGVIDFVPKPVVKERLHAALERYYNNDRNSVITKYLSVKKDDHLHLFQIDKILYFEGDNNYITMHFQDQPVEKYRKTMDSLLSILPSDYLRVHRSYIVGVHNIDHFRISRGGKYEVVLVNKEILPVSRKLYRQVRDEFFNRKKEN